MSFSEMWLLWFVVIYIPWTFFKFRDFNWRINELRQLNKDLHGDLERFKCIANMVSRINSVVHSLDSSYALSVKHILNESNRTYPGIIHQVVRHIDEDVLFVFNALVNKERGNENED